MTDPVGAAELTEEELAAVLTALSLRRAVAAAGGSWAAADDSPLSAWRHRRLAALGRTPRHPRPPS